MPSKKKKYNSRFPPARIKKIMQTDEEIGKVAAAVPVLISKCLEMFLASLLTKAGDVTRSRRAKTMTRSHLKECILSEAMFDFLKDHVANIPDVQNEDEPSGSFFQTEKDTNKKVVRKRSLPKVKKTPKKRAKLGHSTNNNDSEAETDSAEDASENGSGNEFSSSFSSQGLLSPSVQKKFDAQNSVSTFPKQEVGQSGEVKPSFHIPLDALMSGDKVPAPFELKKPLLIATSTDDTETSSSQDDDRNSLFINEKNNHQETHNAESVPGISSPVRNVPSGVGAPQSISELRSPTASRRGVIVANTVAYPVTATSTATPSPSHTISDASRQLPFSPPGANVYATDEPSTSGIVRPKPTSEQGHNHAAKNDSNVSKSLPQTAHGNSIAHAGKSTQDTALPPIIPPPQPGSMLSFLYSSSPMPISSLNMPTTVTTAIPPSSSHETFSYTPLTQHRFTRPGMGPRLPLSGDIPLTGIPPARPEYRKTFPNQDRKPNHAQQLHNEPTAASVGTPGFSTAPYPTYQFLPYTPNASTSYTSQRHYLGYSQSILTPPGHPMPDLNPHYAAHPALCLVKPAPAAISDDEDYDA